MLVLSDIWTPILFYVVYDLLNLYKREVEVSYINYIINFHIFIYNNFYYLNILVS